MEYLTKDDGKQNEISYDNESDEIVKKDQEHKDRMQSAISVNSELSVFSEIGITESSCKISFDKDIDHTFRNVEEPETSASPVENLVPSLSTISTDSVKFSDKSSVDSTEMPERTNGIERTISVEDTEKVEGE